LDKSEQNLNATRERLFQLQAAEQTLNSSIRNSIEVIAIETERNMNEFLPKYLDELTEVFFLFHRKFQIIDLLLFFFR
jgi:hypothetical protein